MIGSYSEYFLISPMTDGFSGAESASDLSQSKAEHVRHSDSYVFRVLTQLCGKRDVLCVLKTHSSWVYLPNEPGVTPLPIPLQHAVGFLR